MSVPLTTASLLPLYTTTRCILLPAVYCCCCCCICVHVIGGRSVQLRHGRVQRDAWRKQRHI